MAALLPSTAYDLLQFCGHALLRIRSSGSKFLLMRCRRTSRLTPITFRNREQTRPNHTICRCAAVFISILTHSSSHACSYGIIFNSSFNNEIHRSQVNSAVGDIIRSFSVNHKVDLDNPDIFILVDTYKSAIAVGISRNYKKWYSDSSLPTASPHLNWSDFLTPGLPSITH